MSRYFANKGGHWAAFFLGRMFPVLFFLIPPMAVVAPKGMAALLIIGALPGVMLWFSGEWRRLRSFWGVVGLIVLLAGYGAATMAWAPEPKRALTVALANVGLMIAGVFLCHAAVRIDEKTRYASHISLLFGGGAALAIIVSAYSYAMVSGDSLWGKYGYDPLTPLNTGVNLLAILIIPILAIFYHYRGVKPVLFFLATFIGIVWGLSSSAAVLGLVAGGTATGFVAWTGKRGALFIGGICALAALAAPYLMSVVLGLNQLDDMLVYLPSSAQHRLAMWDFVLDKIREQWWLGHGLDASRFISQAGPRYAANMELMPLHPHNAFLQIWLELGFLGAMIVAVFIFHIFRQIAVGSPDHSTMGVACGVVVGWLAISSVSYGVWQTWWLASAWILAALVTNYRFRSKG